MPKPRNKLCNDSCVCSCCPSQRNRYVRKFTSQFVDEVSLQRRNDLSGVRDVLVNVRGDRDRAELIHPIDLRVPSHHVNFGKFRQWPFNLVVGTDANFVEVCQHTPLVTRIADHDLDFMPPSLDPHHLLAVVCSSYRLGQVSRANSHRGSFFLNAEPILPFSRNRIVSDIVDAGEVGQLLFASFDRGIKF